MLRKYTLLAIAFVFAFSFVQAQNWTENLPTNKSHQELTLYDYKQAFDEYWKPYNLEKGYYFENGVKKKAKGWKQFQRWYYNLEGQVNPEDGSFPEKTAQQVYNEYLKLNPAQKGQKSANWTEIGPNYSDGGYAGVGRINVVAFHPSNNNIWWVGAPAGGLWMTSNNGSSWTCLTDDNNVLGVSDIAIPSDYSSSQTIYIATGDRDAWDNRSIGVLKSTDAGSTWNNTGLQFNLSNNEMVTRLLMDPNDDETIIAATTNGVYKTTNGGSTWSNQLSSLSFIDMEYKPGDFTTIYGSTEYGEVWRTVDGGSNWNKVLDDGYRIELAVTPANSSYVYALVVDGSSGLEAVYRSTNSGSSFSEVFSGLTTNLLDWSTDGSGSGGQGWYDLSIAVSPTNANTVLVGGINTWRSTNGGSSWTQVNHWYGGGGAPAVHADKHQLKYRSNGDLFECNDGGVYISTNDGTSWLDKTDGMQISQIYKLGISQTVADETIIGLQDNGTKLYSGGFWDDVKGGDGMECLIDYSDVNTQYGTYTNGQISRTTDHWFSSVDIEPSAAGDGAWVTPYIISPTNNSTLYAGYADVWKTTNKGNSWTKISSMNTSSKIRAMAIAPSNNQILFVSDPDQIWKTTNDGGSWTDVTNNLPTWSSSITYIAIKDDDPNTIWVTLSGYNSNNVYVSTDGGSSWSNMSTGLPELPAYTIVQNTQITSTTHLYVGTELGVYFKNGTDNWVAYNDGLPNVKSGELEIYYAASPVDSKLRLASYGRGLWETGLEQENSDLPTVQTEEPTDVTANSATLGGNVTAEGTSSVSERGVVYSTSPNPTTNDTKIIDGSTGTGTYTAPVSGLSSSTTYYTRAYAINSSGTAYGGQEMFTTNCNTFSVPFSEDFEGTDFPPNCWETFRGNNGLGTSNDWESTDDAQSGSKAAYVQYEDVTGGNAEDWMVTPLITLSTECELSFYQKQTYSSNYGSGYYVLVSTTNQTDPASFTIVDSWGESDFTTSYTEKIVDLSAYNNQDVYIAFAMANDDGDDWFIDNINITSNPSPYLTIDPTSETVTSVAGNTTFNVSSNVSWNISDDADWLSVSPSSGSNDAEITVTYDENTGSERSATITVSGTGVSDQTFTLTQEAAPTDAVVFVNPNSQSVNTDQVFSTTIEISDAANLGSFELDLNFDPAYLQANSVSLGDFLGSTGRSVLPISDNIDNVNGLIEYAVTTMGATPQGPDGDGVLLTIEWTSTETLSEDITTDLLIENLQITEINGTVLPSSSINGSVSISSCYTTDFDCDCDVDIIDITMAAFAYGTDLGDPEYNPDYDLDSDEDVDIIDITMVAYDYGWSCGKSDLVRFDYSGSNEDVYLSWSKVRKTGDYFEMDLQLENVYQLGAYEFNIEYDPELIEIVALEEGSFISSSGRKTQSIKNEIDLDKGQLSLAVVTLGSNQNAASGNGILASIRFKTSDIDAVAFNLMNSQLAKPNADIIDHSFKSSELANTDTYIISTFPSPMKEQMTIKYQVDHLSTIEFTIYNSSGAIVFATEKGLNEKGIHTFPFNEVKLNSGVYILSMEQDGKTVDSKRFIVN